MAKRIDIEGYIGWDDNATAEYLAEQLRLANGEDVEIHINSPGGLVGAGLKMYNLIRDYPGKTTAVLAGYAMSMASYIPQACDEVHAKDNAVYMIHNARGGVWGDHNDVQKYGKYLQGLSGISAREFVKVTGKRGKAKSLADVTAMMDSETFLFGAEMQDHGFVDQILDSGDDSDKETSLATAHAVYSEAQARLAGDQDKVRADLQLAMQLFDAAPTQQHTPTPAAPAAGIKQKEEQQMNLNELLATNSAAKAEFDAAISAAKNEGVAEGQKNAQETAKAVSKFIGNAAYPSQVNTMACQVLTGEMPESALTSLVATADMMKEMQAGAGAAAGTVAGGEVAGQQIAAADPNSVVASEDGLQSAIQSAKKDQGRD